MTINPEEIPDLPTKALLVVLAALLAPLVVDVPWFLLLHWPAPLEFGIPLTPGLGISAILTIGLVWAAKPPVYMSLLISLVALISIAALSFMWTISLDCAAAHGQCL